MKRRAIILTCLFLAGSVLAEDVPRTNPNKQAPREFFGTSRTFDSVEAKDAFLRDVFATLGKTQGQLLASTAVWYHWEIGDLAIVVTDTTGVDGKPSVNVMIRKKTNRAIDSGKQ